MYNLTLTEEQYETVKKALAQAAGHSPVVAHVEGSAIQELLTSLPEKGKAEGVYRVSVAIDHGVMVKLNEQTWTHPIGWAPSAGQSAASSLLIGLQNLKPVSDALAAMLTPLAPIAGR